MVYNQDGDTIIVYKTLDGDFVISNDTQITDGSVETYYGNNGSVTVKQMKMVLKKLWTTIHPSK